MVIVEDLPPVLQRVYRAMVEHAFTLSLKQACEIAGVNYNTAKSEIHALRVKGINFYKLITEEAKERLFNEASPLIYQKLIEKAQRGNLKAIELFLRATGDLRSKWEVDGTMKMQVSTNKELIQALQEAKQRLESLRR